MSLVWLGQDRQILQPLFFSFVHVFYSRGRVECDATLKSIQLNLIQLETYIYLFMFKQISNASKWKHKQLIVVIVAVPR